MPKRPITAEDLFDIRFVSDPQISPDGTKILYGLTEVDQKKNKYRTQLHTIEIGTGTKKQWTHGKESASTGRWQPDGSGILFVSKRDDASQIYLLPTDGGEANAVTDLPEGSISGPLWSPDGTKIAFLFRETHHEWTSKAKKEREGNGGTTPPWSMETLWYRLDGDGYFGEQRFKLYVHDLDSGETKQIYDADSLGWYSYDWLPDSSALIVAHSVNKNPLLERANDQLFKLTLDGKAEPLGIEGVGSKGSVRVSPDGKQVAYLGDHQNEEPWGIRNTRLYVADIDGGSPKNLSGDNDFCLNSAALSDTFVSQIADGGGSGLIRWSPDGKKLYVNAADRGSVQLVEVDAESAEWSFLTEGAHVVSGSTLDHSGKRLACAYMDSTNIAEIAVYRIGSGEKAPETLTNWNKEWHDRIELAKPEEVWVDSTDGVKVHAWVMRPPKAKEPTPAILEVHGGPHAQYGTTVFHEFQLLVAQGYTVVYSNPRGSKGYGEAFCSAIKGDWGNKDWDDIKAVSDWMKEQDFIDSSRIGIMGGSYGGYMTNWAVGHSQDYKAAITDRCVSNWVSMAGNSDFPLNRDEYFGGYSYGSLDKIESLWKQSPIAYFDQVKTPMLIIHSEGDLRCNVEQSDQIFYALQAQDIESRYVRYPATTSHGMSRNGPPDMRLHRLREICDWWKRFY